MNKKMIWLTSGLFVALLLVAGGVAALLLMNQSQDTRQQAASPSGTVNFTLSKATLTLEPNEDGTFEVLINTNGALLSSFGYRLIYPASSGITVLKQEKNASLLGVSCSFSSKDTAGQQSIGANCMTEGLVDYSNTVATAIATVTLKAGAQGTETPTSIIFDMGNGGDFITATDKENKDLAAIPQGTLAVTVNSVAALSDNATLSNLTTSQGTLSPAFAGATTNYTTSVASTVASVTVTPTAAESAAVIKVNGTTVPSGTVSGAIALNTGSNTIAIEVTAANGTTKKVYTVIATRAAAEQVAEQTSSTINLSSVQNCNPNEFKAKIEVKENSQPKANVITEFEFNKEKKSATTDSSGFAETTFALPGAGSYTLIANPQGFATKQATVQITACAASTNTNTTTATTVVQCNQTCNSTRVCGTGLSCVGGVCRNPQCQTSSTCSCSGGTNVASQSGTTTLPSTGSVDRTLALLLIGGLLVLGSAQILASRHGQTEGTDY